MRWTTKRLDELVDFYLRKMLDQKKNRGESLPCLANVDVRPRQNLAEVEIDFPTLPVQERISDVLSAYDDLSESNRRGPG